MKKVVEIIFYLLLLVTALMVSGRFTRLSSYLMESGEVGFSLFFIIGAMFSYFIVFKMVDLLLERICKK